MQNATDLTPTEKRVFWHMIADASNKGWQLNEDEARTLVHLGVGLGFIEPDRADKLIDKLTYGQVMLREDGHWACTTCGGNCGQCGDTEFYGNIGFSMDHIVGVCAVPGYKLPRYAVKDEIGGHIRASLKWFGGVVLAVVLIGLTLAAAVMVLL